MHGTIESNFRVEWRPLAQLRGAAAQWRALAASAIAPNVFYEPAFALAAQPMFGSDVGAGLVWSRGASPRLLGFFPARIERWRYGIPLPVLVAWTHPYAPLSAPLVDRDAAAAVIAAWLDHVAGDPGLPDVLLLPIAPIGGGLAAAFDAVLTQRGGTSVAFGSHQRALLAPTGVRNTYLDHAISKHKRRTLRWQRRRLADSGVVSFDSAREPATIAKALGDYLALEAGGWKGRAGTAVRADDALRKFVEGAVTELAGQGKAQVVRLRVGDRAVAAGIVLRSGDTAWFWKIAYDESFARLSPGVQLVLDLSQELLSDESIARANSCATADHPMIDHIWRERLPLADLLVRIGADGAAKFALIRTLESLRRSAIASAKRMRNLLRRR